MYAFWTEIRYADYLTTCPILVLDLLWNLDAPYKWCESELFRLIREIADSGKGVLFRSTEIAELTNLCNRIYVIKNGETRREVTNVDEAELIKLINE